MSHSHQLSTTPKKPKTIYYHDLIIENTEGFDVGFFTRYAHEHKLLDKALPDKILHFFDNIKNGVVLADDAIQVFKNSLSTLSTQEQHLIGTLLMVKTTSLSKEFFRSDVRIALERHIDKATDNQQSFEEFNFFKDLPDYHALLNLAIILQDTELQAFAKLSPYVDPLRNRIIRAGENIPLLLNMLILMNKMPLEVNYLKETFKAPYYPADEGKPLTKDKIKPQRGIKDSSLYYPYKKIDKIASWEISDHTYLATNRKKSIFIKFPQSTSNSRLSILASKIACFVDKNYFASERLLDNRLIGSKKLKNAMSLLDPDLEIPGGIIYPGTGTIDEVLSFIVETDKNTENFMYIDRGTESPTMAKYDYDKCDPTDETKEVSNYMLSNALILKAIHHKQNPSYLNERLIARLKLAFLSEELISIFCKKSYLDDDLEKKAMRILAKKAEKRLESFLEDPAAENFIKKNPEILANIFSDTIKYITRHVNPEESEVVIKSIQKRRDYIQAKIEQTFPLKFKKSSEEKTHDRPSAETPSTPARAEQPLLFDEEKYPIVHGAFSIPPKSTLEPKISAINIWHVKKQSNASALIHISPPSAISYAFIKTEDIAITFLKKKSDTEPSPYFKVIYQGQAFKEVVCSEEQMQIFIEIASTKGIEALILEFNRYEATKDVAALLKSVTDKNQALSSHRFNRLL